MRLVILESPYAGDIEAHVRYGRACLRDCLFRDESPIASHLLLTQQGVLHDNVQSERVLGMAAGLEWATKADAMVVYTDKGISPGMRAAVKRAEEIGLKVEYRSLLEHPHAGG